MTTSKLELDNLIEFFRNRLRLRQWLGALECVVLLWIGYAIVERSDRAIADRANGPSRTFQAVAESALFVSEDEQRVANNFISDTLPRLMKMGLITKYQRNETTTALLVAGRVWKRRTRFVKESLLSAVSAYNKVNGLSPQTFILDNHTGRLYAQALSADRREVFE